MRSDQKRKCMLIKDKAEIASKVSAESGVMYFGQLVTKSYEQEFSLRGDKS